MAKYQHYYPNLIQKQTYIGNVSNTELIFKEEKYIHFQFDLVDLVVILFCSVNNNNVDIGLSPEKKKEEKPIDIR
ncbi:hypothetical protein DERP_014974 [Dermatophagoides pteronyssinus]|uniref:Uncharacterized protein n=1 Tax=Dermatophagoides pteronyssinus TaxID=6956 RepID=A0ABQ8JGE8_DERPT|nr:hypothetical protein DERP_014974 [Dermatophagoides pteronyssinus]